MCVPLSVRVADKKITNRLPCAKTESSYILKLKKKLIILKSEREEKIDFHRISIRTT